MSPPSIRPSTPSGLCLNVYCGQCDAPLGFHNTNWVRLTSTYARPVELGVSFGTQIAETERTVPNIPKNATLEGCSLSEITCTNCLKAVGQVCKASRESSKTYLVGRTLYRLSRVYFKDASTFSYIEPTFDNTFSPPEDEDRYSVTHEPPKPANVQVVIPRGSTRHFDRQSTQLRYPMALSQQENTTPQPDAEVSSADSVRRVSVQPSTTVPLNEEDQSTTAILSLQDVKITKILDSVRALEAEMQSLRTLVHKGRERPFPDLLCEHPSRHGEQDCAILLEAIKRASLNSEEMQTLRAENGRLKNKLEKIASALGTSIAAVTSSSCVSSLSRPHGQSTKLANTSGLPSMLGKRRRTHYHNPPTSSENEIAQVEAEEPSKRLDLISTFGGCKARSLTSKNDRRTNWDAEVTEVAEVGTQPEQMISARPSQIISPPNSNTNENEKQYFDATSNDNCYLPEYRPSLAVQSDIPSTLHEANRSPTADTHTSKLDASSEEDADLLPAAHETDEEYNDPSYSTKSYQPRKPRRSGVRPKTKGQTGKQQRASAETASHFPEPGDRDKIVQSDASRPAGDATIIATQTCRAEDQDRNLVPDSADRGNKTTRGAKRVFSELSRRKISDSQKKAWIIRKRKEAPSRRSGIKNHSTPDRAAESARRPYTDGALKADLDRTAQEAPPSMQPHDQERNRLEDGADTTESELTDLESMETPEMILADSATKSDIAGPGEAVPPNLEYNASNSPIDEPFSKTTAARTRARRKALNSGLLSKAHQNTARESKTGNRARADENTTADKVEQQSVQQEPIIAEVAQKHRMDREDKLLQRDWMAKEAMEMEEMMVP